MKRFSASTLVVEFCPGRSCSLAKRNKPGRRRPIGRTRVFALGKEPAPWPHKEYRLPARAYEYKFQLEPVRAGK